MAITSALSILILDSCLKPLVGQQQAHTSPECVAAAAAAKSLQSCPTLCDPIDGSPPGSPPKDLAPLSSNKYQPSIPLDHANSHVRTQPQTQPHPTTGGKQSHFPRLYNQLHGKPTLPLGLQLTHNTWLHSQPGWGQPRLPAQTWQLALPQQIAHAVHVGEALRTYSSGDQSRGCHWATQDVYFIRPLQE